MGPGESSPGAFERRWRRLLVVVPWRGVGPFESKQRGYPKRIRRVARVPCGNLEANRHFGLLPAPVLDRIPRNADPAAVFVVELGVPEDSTEYCHFLRES